MWAFLKLETAAPSLDILAGANASSALPPALPPPPPPPPPPETADLAALFSLPPSGKGRFGHISYMMASLLCTYAVAGVVRSNLDQPLRLWLRRRLQASGRGEGRCTVRGRAHLARPVRDPAHEHEERHDGVS